MRKYRIAGATVNQTPLDWNGNIDNIKHVIKQAKANKVEILCLPELSITGYGCEDLFLSDWLSEKALTFLPELISETDGILTTFNLPIRHSQKLYNCSVLVHDKTILGVYAKQYMALDGVHYEPRWFNPWPIGLIESITLFGTDYPIGDLTFDFEDWKIGFEICEDAWRGNDRPACRLFEQGVNIILNPSASHFAMQKTKERLTLVEESSQRFECTYVYTNLLGNEAGRMIYDGEIIVAQKGRTYLRNDLLSFKAHQLAFVDISTDESSLAQENLIATIESKEIEFPKATSLALFDYLRKSKSNGYTLSLSGGADSATCAVMVAEMVKRGINTLGKKEFTKAIHKPELAKFSEKEIVGKIFNTAYQGTKNSSTTTLNAAKTLANSIGAKFYDWTIDASVDASTKIIENVLDRKLTWEQDDLALQNIQARSRSPIIWMLTNITNTLLLTTSNRSEGDVGYATMDGDTSGSLAPISSVDKNFIRQWLVFAQKELGYQGLASINVLPPTAELRPSNQNQTDEDDLMPYSVMVEIEKLAIRDHKSPLQVYKVLLKQDIEEAALLKNHIIKFFRLWSRNQWKRERLAPAFHLDEFNVDPRTWCRFPILSAGYKEEIKLLEEFDS